MCGITFIHRLDKRVANKSILKRYHKQKSRGSDGFGYVAIQNNKLKSYKRAKLESQIKTFIEKEKAETILFHHRFPTSTPNFKESAHPIKVSNMSLKYDYYLVHNGIITNADDLKEKHEALGFIYNTEIKKKFLTSGQTYTQSCFNDSEALAIDIALAIDKGTNKIEAKGSIAFIVAKVHKSSNNVVAIYYGRNTGNPLKIGKTKDLISIGSESEGTIVPAEVLFKLDLKTGETTQASLDIPEYTSYSYGYGNYGYRTSDGYTTTFGDDDEDEKKMERDWGWADRQNQLDFPKGEVSQEMADRWNTIDWEIMQTEALLEGLEAKDDGSPEAQNSIIECEAILDSLNDERDALDTEITRATLAQAD